MGAGDAASERTWGPLVEGGRGQRLPVAVGSPRHLPGRRGPFRRASTAPCTGVVLGRGRTGHACARAWPAPQAGVGLRRASVVSVTKVTGQTEATRPLREEAAAPVRAPCSVPAARPLPRTGQPLASLGCGARARGLGLACWPVAVVRPAARGLAPVPRLRARQSWRLAHEALEGP